MPIGRKGWWNKANLEAARAQFSDLLTQMESDDPFIQHCQRYADTYVLSTMEALRSVDRLTSDTFNTYERERVEESVRDLFQNPFADPETLQAMIDADWNRFWDSEYYATLCDAGVVGEDGMVDIARYAPKRHEIEREFLRESLAQGSFPALEQIERCNRLMQHYGLMSAVNGIAQTLEGEMQREKGPAATAATKEETKTAPASTSKPAPTQPAKISIRLTDSGIDGLLSDLKAAVWEQPDTDTPNMAEKSYLPAYLYLTSLISMVYLDHEEDKQRMPDASQPFISDITQEHFNEAEAHLFDGMLRTIYGIDHQQPIPKAVRNRLQNMRASPYAQFLQGYELLDASMEITDYDTYEHNRAMLYAEFSKAMEGHGDADAEIARFEKDLQYLHLKEIADYVRNSAHSHFAFAIGTARHADWFGEAITDYGMLLKPQLRDMHAQLDRLNQRNASSQYEEECREVAFHYMDAWQDITKRWKILSTDKFSRKEERMLLRFVREAFDDPEVTDEELYSYMHHQVARYTTSPYQAFLTQQGCHNPDGSLNVDVYSERRDGLNERFRWEAEEKGIDAEAEIRRFDQVMRLAALRSAVEDVRSMVRGLARQHDAIGKDTYFPGSVKVAPKHEARDGGFSLN